MAIHDSKILGSAPDQLPLTSSDHGNFENSNPLPHLPNSGEPTPYTVGDSQNQASQTDEKRRRLDRKRQRNREAAERCRKKRDKKAADLDQEKSSELKRGEQLKMEISKLEERLRLYNCVKEEHQKSKACRKNVPEFFF